MLKKLLLTGLILLILHLMPILPQELFSNVWPNNGQENLRRRQQRHFQNPNFVFPDEWNAVQITRALDNNENSIWSRTISTTTTPITSTTSTTTSTTPTTTTINRPIIRNTEKPFLVYVNNQPIVPTLVPFWRRATTPSLGFLNCLRNCPTTPEFNPVCASNRETYHNEQKFHCAKYCGADIKIVRRGNCYER